MPFQSRLVTKNLGKLAPERNGYVYLIMVVIPDFGVGLFKFFFLIYISIRRF